MTPKEKAEELYVGYWYLTNDSRIAKQCAIIAVNHIMHVIDWHEFETPNEELNYWNQVKEEIKLL